MWESNSPPEARNKLVFLLPYSLLGDGAASAVGQSHFGSICFPSRI